MLEMPIAQLEQHVQMELDTNPYLEGSYDDRDDTLPNDDGRDDDDTMTNDDGREDATQQNDDERDDDDIPCVHQEQRRMEDGNQKTFIDTLVEQMSMLELTDMEHQIMEHILYSLDDDGLLRKDLMTISDELAIYNGLFVEEDQIEDVLLKIQEFDPAGVAARSLQECLLIQVGRMKATPIRMLMYRVIDECYDDFTSNHWDKICRRLSISEAEAEDLRHGIRRLNPKPGASYGEAQGRSLQQITPDVVISIDYDENISFELNNGRVPRLHVVKEDEEELRNMIANKSGDKETIEFLQHHIDKSRTFVEALRQRNETIVRTMKAIIRLQRAYLLSGDESDLKPMVLRDVADMTGLDLSTISRVSRAKYVQTPWGTFPLRHFFSEAYTTKDGETMSTKSIKLALREIIAGEDKKRPLSDDKLVAVMKEKGYPIARRTIAKYREQAGIPVARLRKQ